MNHSLKNQDAHRRLARGANAVRKTVRMQVRSVNQSPFWWEWVTKAQSDCAAKHKAKEHAEKAGFIVVRFGSVS